MFLVVYHDSFPPAPPISTLRYSFKASFETYMGGSVNEENIYKVSGPLCCQTRLIHVSLTLISVPVTFWAPK